LINVSRTEIWWTSPQWGQLIFSVAFQEARRSKQWLPGERELFEAAKRAPEPDDDDADLTPDNRLQIVMIAAASVLKSKPELLASVISWDIKAFESYGWT
jgi:hypothetical protein